MSMSSEAIAAKMAASLGVTDMDVAEISRMLELKHTLLPMFQVSVAFLVLAWFAVSLRVYVRASILRSFHWDDWLILLTLCVFTACCACLIAIEDIERSSAASKALTKGFLAQYDLIDKIFGVSHIINPIDKYVLTLSSACDGIHGPIHRHHSCFEARVGHLFPSHHSRELLVAEEDHLHLYRNLYDLRPDIHIHRHLPVWQPNQLLPPGGAESLCVRHDTSTALLHCWWHECFD